MGNGTINCYGVENKNNVITSELKAIRESAETSERRKFHNSTFKINGGEKLHGKEGVPVGTLSWELKSLRSLQS